MTDLRWRTPDDLVRIGFDRSRVVLMNEAHNGTLRCVRTRDIGRQVLPVAHACGARYLAAEALALPFAQQANDTRTLPPCDAGYLSQPEMRSFLQAALDLGWTLLPYEADAVAWLRAHFPAEFAGLDPLPASRAELDQLAAIVQRLSRQLRSMDWTNWREEQQALNLVTHLQSLPADARLLVWCGNSHLSKAHGENRQPDVPSAGWVPMGAHLRRLAGFDPFALDQTVTIRFSPDHAIPAESWVMQQAGTLAAVGGTAGFLHGEAPRRLRLPPGVDAILLSIDNALT